ncbi:PTS ascorbate transporter subunit IIC [uncultured Mitsuokella sp.]|uniref:PTS ascorbate transporter subunit IIC n=1 Tax=uncultured Mitsuokella sp. TaxID=453120 RepID=UPI002621CD7B|nr:PTS ascorbate transporter subunit IIC [uncultured Mitsuokella sp.]
MMNLIFSFFNQPAFIVGVIALIGLIVQKKNAGQIISGTSKTIIGFLVFSIGSGAISGALNILGPAFESAFSIQGVIPTNEAVIALVQDKFGTSMALIMAFGFLVNLVLARFTPLKYVFLTGHHILFMAGLLAAILTVIGFEGVSLIAAGALLLGISMVLTPALVQPFYRAVTGNDTVAMGHYNALTYCLAGWLAKKFGDKSRSTEDVKVPEGLSFFRDNVISTAVVMLIIYIATFLLADDAVIDKMSAGQNKLIFAIVTAMQFTAGFVIVLQGVRMMLAEIIPAFKGISEKIVPNAVPALDCPVIFPFAPNAVIIGFLASFVGGVVSFLILPFTGLALIIPGMIPLFFVGAAAGVIANAQGGLRGVLIGCFFNGLILNTLPALLLPLMGSLGYSNSTFGDADFVLNGIVVGNIGKGFGQAGVWALIVVLLVIFFALNLRKKKAPAK